MALSLKRTIIHPPLDRLIPGAHKLAPYFSRRLPDGPQLTIRHAFPPNWEPPTAGKWIHIQPWEFGMLPKAWVVPLRDQVAEIWAPSQYVKDVYVRSSIPEAKIQVIPWGIDPDVYQPGLPDRVLSTDKSFRFLFVGGTLARKGFDLALDAYLAEFSPDEDVCLVVKDAGTKSFYRIGNYRERVLEASADPRAPAIVYLESEMTEGQRASLYCACQCLLAPYRGEGFGLPILEAMACGLPPIIPRGGPTDDFASDETAFLLPSQAVPCPHDWEACGQPTELSVELNDLRRAMRKAFEEREETRHLGAAASSHARTNFTWRQAIRRMTERIQRLAGHHGPAPMPVSDPSCAAPLDLSVCVLARDCEKLLPDCLARLRPFAKELLVGDLGSRDRTILIAKEYGAVVVDLTGHEPVDALAALRERATAAWTLDLRPEDLLDEQDWEVLAGKLNNAAADDRELAIGLSSAADPGSNGHARQEHQRHWVLRRSRPLDNAPAPAAAARNKLPRANGHALKAGGPTVDIAVVTVGYNLPGATRALVESALRDCRHRVTFFIVSHSRLPEKVDELHELAHRSDVVYRDYGQNRGLAKSWNEGILWAYDNHFQAVLVVNEDLLFSPGDLARLAETAYQQSDRFLVTGRCFHSAENRWASSEYGCFALNRLALDTLGCFDENFFPVYCEDSDYRRRAALAGLQSGFCADVSLSHQGSASLREPEVARQNQETYWGNRAYYARKWGGDAGEETFPFPFNDRRFGVHIDRHVREVPYPGFNRTDQQLVLI